MLKILYKEHFKLTKTVQVHLLCWFIFISYEIGLTVTATGNTAGLTNYILFYLLNISLFYTHSLLVLNKNSKTLISAIWRIPLFTIIELILYFVITVTISIYLSKKEFGILALSQISFAYAATALWRAVNFIMYATGYYALISYNRKKEKTLNQAIENEKLKNELLRAEQDFLRAQINPHLLFNTLSFIKYAAKKKPDEADEAVMRLSEIMGFALENNSETILLIKELEQVENIIALNQLRFNHTLHIAYTTEIANEDIVIVPIIILTLVENIFKHGNLMNEAYPAKIKIESTSEYLLIQTSNMPNPNRMIRTNQQGLTNINSRLNQFYKDNYYFNYGVENGMFKVELKINLNVR